MKKSLKLYLVIYARMAALAVVLGELLRVLLLFNQQTTDIGFSVLEWLQIFFFGAINDLCAVTLGFTAVWLFLMLMTHRKYGRTVGYVLLALFATAFVYVTFFKTIFDEYGSVVPLIASILTGYICFTFALRLFLPRIRRAWTLSTFMLLLVVSVGAIIFNTVSEYVFWSEFGVRYNFIAVDYLVYTNEVIGNIMESYPIVPLFSALILLTVVCAWWLYGKAYKRVLELDSWRWKAVAAPLHIVAACVAVGLLLFNTRFQQHDNVYANELQANGCYKFCDAFVKNELDYGKFYLTLPEGEAERMIHDEYRSTADNLHDAPADSIQPRRPNIVLITIESMSASFMERFGNTEHLTPVLDSLYRHSLAFDRVIATGNRTVRGLEAVTLSLPPCPGQSLIKRSLAGKELQSTGSLLRSMGYTTTYFYGGNAYFDNMSAFFTHCGYGIVDRAAYKPSEVTFENIWGVCDQDAYRKVLQTLDAESKAGRPFFAHVMSVSNHRPYTYPDGCISIPSTSKSRQGGVMYSDYALGEFLHTASTRPWFSNTVFVITADHCASSAGKTELPLEKYHIPALIYAPSLVQPQIVSRTVSQIDLVPTLLARLGIRYRSRFYGRDALAPDYHERAFVATYQDLGYLDSDTLTVLSPVNRCKQLAVRPTPEDAYHTEPCEKVDSTLVRRAVAYYQTSSAWH